MLMMGYFVDPGGQHVGPFWRSQARPFAFQVVLAVLVELAGGAVQAERDLFTGGVAGLVDGFRDHLMAASWLATLGQAAFVAHGGATCPCRG